MIGHDDELRVALRDLAEDWRDTGDLLPRVRRRIRQRRNRLRAFAATFGVALAAAALLPTLVANDSHRGDEIVTSDDGGAAEDGWRLLPNAPIEGRAFPAAVWTGSEMIVWGGTSLDGRTAFSDGAAYDPGAGEWRRLAEGLAQGRYTVAVWSGSELLLWGHVPTSSNDPTPAGAAYDPSRDSWRALAEAPVASYPYASGVWSGSELLVWGGYDIDDVGHVNAASDGAAYNPETDSWRILPPSPLEGRFYQGTAWTGSEMVIWGGAAGDGAAGHTFADGAAYDPASNEWSALPPAPISGRSDPSVVWTGNEVLIWGGIDDSPAARTNGALYEPASSTWHEVAAAPGVSGTTPFPSVRAVWVGDQLIAWGIDAGQDAAGYVFDPGSGSWRSMPDAPVRARGAYAVVWTGDELLIWGGARPGDVPLSDGAAWHPSEPPTSTSPPGPASSTEEQRAREAQQRAEAAAAAAARRACAAMPDTGVTVERYVLTAIPYGFVQASPVETSSTGFVDAGGTSESTVRFVDESGRAIDFTVVGNSDTAAVAASAHAGAQTMPVEIRHCPLESGAGIGPTVWNVSETPDRIAATGDGWEYGLTTVVGTGGVSREELLRLLRGVRT